MSTIENSNECRRSPFPSWMKHLNAAVVRRSLVLTPIIGGVLILFNQSAALFSDADFDWFRLALAFLTPFVVITISQLVATQQAVSLKFL